MHGTRKPPSMTVPCSVRTACAASGQVKSFGAVVGAETTMCLSSKPRSLSFCINQTDVVIELGHAGFFFRPAIL